MGIRLSIIIVSYNSEDFISQCVESILKFKPKDAELIVLDNASTDLTLRKLQKFKEKIKLISSKENLGFSKGNNLATQGAKGEFLFFINPDTKLTSNIFDQMIEYYLNADDIGIMGPKLVMSDGKVQPSAIKLPTLWGAFKACFFNRRNDYFQYVPETKIPLEVECLFGAAYLIKKDVFERIGKWDEKYFLYYEDIQLCKDVRKIGKKIIYYPLVEVKHIVGGTKSDKKYQENIKSAQIYHGKVKAFLFQLIFKTSRFIHL